MTKVTEEIVRDFIKAIGDDPDREGLIDTPKRISKMWGEVFGGYDLKNKPEITVFNNGKDGVEYKQMVLDTGYFFSHCEHHGVPFFGTYHFAYIPGKKVMGLSKVARVVDYHSSKLQIQERLVKDIVDHIESSVEPKGVALVMKARHLCKEMRGVKKINGSMTTSELRGSFHNDPQTRQEFLSFVNSQHSQNTL